MFWIWVTAQYLNPTTTFSLALIWPKTGRMYTTETAPALKPLWDLCWKLHSCQGKMINREVIWAMPERNQFFSCEVFPNRAKIIQTIQTISLQIRQNLFPLYFSSSSFYLRFKVFWQKLESKCRSFYTKALLENWKRFCSKQQIQRNWDKHVLANWRDHLLWRIWLSLPSN